MSRRVRRRLLATIAVGAACASLAPRASAVNRAPPPPPAPTAPALSAAALRGEARDALARVVLAMDDASRARVTGAYVAFETGGADVVALAACDDDGDPVVVVSDALLALADFASQARALDDVRGAGKVDDYARFLGAQEANARVLPPPPGFFDAASTHDPRVVAREAPRRREMLEALVASELAHVVARDVACPHPTATQEAGDATWSDAEARAARALASHAYTAARVITGDAFAARALVALEEPRDVAVGAAGSGVARADADASDAAYVALLTLLDRLGATDYARFHATAPLANRVAAVRASAASARAAPAAPASLASPSSPTPTGGAH